MFQKLRLSGSQLKMLALITMTIDHIGFIFFPQVWWLRAIGRLAFPIFAYMIAEGCRYTRRRMRYWGSIALLALVCDAAEMIAEGSLYQSVMTTFTLSVGMIYALDWAMRGENRREQLLRSLLPAGAVLLSFFLCELLPLLLWTTDFHVDYRFSGALLPVLVYVGKRRRVTSSPAPSRRGRSAPSRRGCPAPPWRGTWTHAFPDRRECRARRHRARRPSRPSRAGAPRRRAARGCGRSSPDGYS